MESFFVGAIFPVLSRPGAFSFPRNDEIQNRCAIYARVPTYKQKDDLERQRQRLADFASARGWEIALEVSDIGSGVNDHRPKLFRCGFLTFTRYSDIVEYTSNNEGGRSW